MAETLLTVQQAAERLQLRPLTIRRQLQRGALRGIKRGRVWRVPESALLESSHNRTAPTPEPTFVEQDERGVPVVAGTGIKVAHLAALKRAYNLSPEQLQEQLPQLSLAQVYGALAFYLQHQAEIDADLAHREERVAQWEQEGRPRQPSRRELQSRARDRQLNSQLDKKSHPGKKGYPGKSSRKKGTNAV